MPLPLTPAIIFFAAEHLYGVKLTSYLFTIPYNLMKTGVGVKYKKSVRF